MSDFLAMWRELIAGFEKRVERLESLIRTGNFTLPGSAVRGSIPAASVPAHASTHQNAGADEISVAGLSGLLTDAQTPVDHDHSGDAGDGATFDAANLTSGAATDNYVLTADGVGGAAWEAPAGGAVDAADVTYTPTTATDWDGDADPGDVDNALDQLAERVDDLEGIAPGTDANAIHDNTASEISAIAEKASPVSADMLIIEDSEAANVKKMVQVGNLPGSGAVGDVYACNGRLTLTTATPVTTADVTAATTLYFTPFKGDKVALYDTGASAWDDPVSFTERSLDISGLTANTNYDIFLYDNSGTLTLAGVAWTNDTTRATALASLNGVYVKTDNHAYRYLGTIRITGTTGQCEDSTARRFVWNYYNRCSRALKATDTTASWTYTTATYRAANGSTTDGIGRFSFVLGISEAVVTAVHHGTAKNSAGSVTVRVGIDLDGTTTSDAVLGSGYLTTAGDQYQIATIYQAMVAIGSHYLQRTEYSTATGTTTWYGLNAGQTGMLAEILA